MTIGKLLAAQNEARRFVRLADLAVARIKEEYKDKARPLDHLVAGSAETAAARRASMDLTRALAALRKS